MCYSIIRITELQENFGSEGKKYIKQICFHFIFYVIKDKFIEAWCLRLLNDFKFFTLYYAFNKENDEF